MSDSDGEQLLAQIKRKYRREIAELNGHLFDDSGDRMLFRSRKVEDWNPPGITVRSLLDRHTTLTIMNSYEPIDDLDPHAPPGGVLILLSVAGQHKLLQQPLPVPEAEADAWARAAFGPWAARAYYQGPRGELRSKRTQALFYAVYLDHNRQPRANPDHTLPHQPLAEKTVSVG